MSQNLLSEKEQLQFVHDKLRNIIVESQRIGEQYFKSKVVQNEKQQINNGKGLNTNQEEKSQDIIKFSKNLPEEQNISKEIVFPNQDLINTNENPIQKLLEQQELIRQISEIEKFFLELDENLKVKTQELEKNQEICKIQNLEEDVQKSNFRNLLNIQFHIDDYLKAISSSEPENEEKIRYFSEKIKEYQFNQRQSQNERFQNFKKDIIVQDNSTNVLQSLFCEIDELIRKQCSFKGCETQKKKNLAQEFIHHVQNNHPNEPKLMLCVFLLSKQYFEIQKSFLQDLKLYQSKLDNELSQSQK